MHQSDSADCVRFANVTCMCINTTWNMTKAGQTLNDNLSHGSEQKAYTVCQHVRRHSIAPQDNPKHGTREEQTRPTAASETLLLKAPFVLFVSLQQHKRF